MCELRIMNYELRITNVVVSWCRGAVAPFLDKDEQDKQDIVTPPYPPLLRRGGRIVRRQRRLRYPPLRFPPRKQWGRAWGVHSHRLTSLSENAILHLMCC